MRSVWFLSDQRIGRGLCWMVVVGSFSLASVALAQENQADAKVPKPAIIAPGTKDELSLAPSKVDVLPIARDQDIRNRLQSVLETTRWFTNPKVNVDQGVVFLSGQAKTEEIRKWAGDLARNTQDVVAVANRIEVTEPAIWDLSPASSGLVDLWRELVRSTPFVLFGLLVIGLAGIAGVFTTRFARVMFQNRIRAQVLRGTFARSLGTLVFLSGVYIVLRVAGLTQLALTVVGGTGLIGLAFGIAFREITENFLASIFLSMQKPFESGDLIEVSGIIGYVQQLNVRVTVLMTLDGNLVQIPNSAVYKGNLRNFSTNANRRESFTIGIGYNESISNAQDVALKVLEEHPAVLKSPEPWVLVDSLNTNITPPVVNLCIYFWLNGADHSWLKMRSSMIRLVTVAFQNNGILPPTPLILPSSATSKIEPRQNDYDQLGKSIPEGETVSTAPQHIDTMKSATKAEGGLSSEAQTIKDQAKQVAPLKSADDLLRTPAAKPDPPVKVPEEEEVPVA